MHDRAQVIIHFIHTCLIYLIPEEKENIYLEKTEV